MEVFLRGGSKNIKSYIDETLLGGRKKFAQVIFYKNTKKFDLGYQKILLEDGIKYMTELRDTADFDIERSRYQKILDDYKFLLKEINKRLKTK